MFHEYNNNKDRNDKLVTDNRSMAKMLNKYFSSVSNITFDSNDINTIKHYY